MGVQAFVVDVADDSCVDGEEAAGFDNGAVVRVWFRRFCALKEYVTPSVSLPIRENFLGISGGHVRRLGASDTQRRVLL